MARRRVCHVRAEHFAVALLVPCQVGTAIQCLHSTCSDEYCLTQDAVITELVDCGLLVSTYTVEQDDGSFISYDWPVGRSTNGVEFDACQRSEIRLGYGSPVVTKYDCATTDMLDRSRYKCNQATHGTDPWSPEGLTETQGGGGLYVYYCCSTDDCTADTPSDSNVGSGNGNSGENVVTSPSSPGFQYSQDPSWQDGTGRNCVCTRQWDDDANAFDECVPTVWANPLLQSDSLGACNAFSDQGTATWRIKLQGTGTKPGFAFGVDVAIRNSWQAWCVNCEAGASQVHFYSDGRCSNSALTTSFELELDRCAVDGIRGIGNGVYYTATCGASDIPASACPGTVAVEPLALSIGVHSRNDCRGATVGGFEWRVTAASIEAAPTGVLGGETWGASGACIPYSSLQTNGLDTGGFLLSELLQLRSIAGLSAATPLARAYPHTPIPDTDSVAFRMCASHSSGLTLAWYSDLSCADPMVLSAPQIGDQATSASDLLSTNGTTGMEYPLSCTSAGDLPFRSSRAQPLMADGRSIDRRWVYVELNTSVVPLLSSCPALPPPPPPDVDCAGDWTPCTAACEQQRTWIGTRQPLGLGRACPSSRPCSAGDGECVGSTTEAETSMTLIVMGVAAAIILALACGFGVRQIFRTKRRGEVSPSESKKTNNHEGASQSSSNDSTDSDDGTVRHKRQLKYLKSGKQGKEEEDAGNGAGNAVKTAKIEVKREVTERTDHDNVSVYSATSDEESENEKLQHDSNESINNVESKSPQLAVMMTAKHTLGKQGKEQLPITVSSSSESDSDHESAKSSRRNAGAVLAATGASMIMRGGRAGLAGRGSRGGRGSRAVRARGQVRGVARAAFAFGRGRGSTQLTRKCADSEQSEDSDGSETEDESLAHEEAARLRQKLAAADKQRARERARAKAIAKARSRGARGTYMSDAAVATLPKPVPEPELQQLPGQLPGSTQQVAPAPAPSWIDDAPGGKNAQAKAVAAAARVSPKLRIPASLSSVDLREALRQQQDMLSNPSGQQAQADGAMDEARANAKAKARARAVAAARRRQGRDVHGNQNAVVERARSSAAAASASSHSLKEKSFATASDELVTPAQKALRGLPVDDLKSLRAMLHELEEQ